MAPARCTCSPRWPASSSPATPSSRFASWYFGASGLDTDVYLERWPALTAALFVISGLLYAIRRAWGRR